MSWISPLLQPLPYVCPCPQCQRGMQWNTTYFPPPAQPWECPRCHKMHGPLSQTCDCKPLGAGKGEG